LDWQNSVIIFDEAHNLEKVASDASSFTLSSTDLAACVQEVQSVLRALNANKQHSSSEKEEDKGDKDVVIVDDRRTPPSIEGTVRVLKGLFEFEKKLDSVLLDKSGPGYTPSAVLPGNHICIYIYYFT
jgi:Rad3-related DNA helicase